MEIQQTQSHVSITSNLTNAMTKNNYTIVYIAVHQHPITSN
jgi:hypothetical protein